MKFPIKAAISTAYFCATTHLPSRIRVKARSHPTVFFSIHILSEDDDVTVDELHRLAVEKYMSKFRLDWGSFISGWTGNENVHVFIPHGYCIVSSKFANGAIRTNCQ